VNVAKAEAVVEVTEASAEASGVGHAEDVVAHVVVVVEAALAVVKMQAASAVVSVSLYLSY
jgi:hypothetical protein